MLRERNKEIALLMLKNLINDISEDRFFVMDAEIMTADPRILDQYASASGEQTFKIRVRIDERAIQVKNIVAGAMKVARERHSCGNSFITSDRVATLNILTCRCGAKVEVTDQEALAV